MALVWERDGDAYYATVAGSGGTDEVHLAVEAVIDGSWTWTMWRAGYPPRLARYGIADTVQEAMRAAEHAV
jgi:hypothetical protein